MRYLIGAVLAFGLIFFQNCGTEVINPTAVPVVFEIAPYNVAPASSKITTLSVSGLTLCIEHLIFKTETDGESDENSDDGAEVLDISLGEVVVTPGGTVLGEFNIPQGNYKQIEIELEPQNCGKSLIVTNDNGTFDTEEEIELELEGDIVVDGSTESVNLIIEQIVQALQTVTSGSQIPEAVKSAVGEYESD